MPIGLYLLKSSTPTKGQLAIIRLPEPVRTLANVRGYLPTRALLIKPVVAGAGDRVCRHGAIITINGRPRAHAKMLDARQRPLPRWHRCRHLATSQLFVLSTVPGSFDSRYLGAIDRDHVIGTAVFLWTR
ncbi:MAG: S26 family signal peptidase [Hyphomicrobiaceae bacterium]|nr:S26 family signal peptidase [Hyphomicrobiaceae bacterium]